MDDRDDTTERPAAGYGSLHPQTHLGYEILPYLRDLDGHEWTSEEREFLWRAERVLGRPLTEAEQRLWVAQARMIGDLPQP